MKTFKENALDYFEWRGGSYTDKDVKDLTLLLKIQDRDTRHACAEAVLCCQYVCETPAGDDAISPNDAYSACINAS